MIEKAKLCLLGKNVQNIFYKYILKYFSLDIIKRGAGAGSFFGIFIKIFG